MIGARFGETNEDRDPKDNLALLKNLIGIFLVVVLLVSAFWLSFLVGQRMLIPVTSNAVAENNASGIENASEEPTTAEALIITDTAEATQTEVLLPHGEAKLAKSTLKVVLPSPKEEPKPEALNLVYKVQTGFFRQYSNAQALSQQLKDKGFANTIESLSSGFFRVQVGAFGSRLEAQKVLEQVQKSGFEAIIVYRE